MLDLAILGLLKEQPLHGYELKKRYGNMVLELKANGVSCGKAETDYCILTIRVRGGRFETISKK